MQVLINELQALQKACEGLQKGYRPGITFVIVQKRHHAKLFPTNPRDGVWAKVEYGACVHSLYLWDGMYSTCMEYGACVHSLYLWDGMYSTCVIVWWKLYLKCLWTALLCEAIMSKVSPCLFSGLRFAILYRKIFTIFQTVGCNFHKYFECYSVCLKSVQFDISSCAMQKY